MEFDLRLPSTDPVERRRLQNRLAQRKFRLKKAADNAHADTSTRRGSSKQVPQAQPQITLPTEPAVSIFPSPMALPTDPSLSTLFLSPQDTPNPVAVMPSSEIPFDDVDPLEGLLASSASSILPDVTPPPVQPPFAPDFSIKSASVSSATSPSSTGSINLPTVIRAGSEVSMPMPATTLLPIQPELQPDPQQSLVPYRPPDLTPTTPILPPPRDQILYETQPDPSLRILSTTSPEEALDGWLGTLHIAAQKGNDAIVRLLLQRASADCNERDSDGRTALMYAVIEGHEPVVRSLLAHGARVGEADRDRRSALHLAVLYRRESILRLLLAQAEPGLDVNAYDVAGWTPLHMAIDRDFEAGTVLLLENGANLGSKARKCPFIGKKIKASSLSC